MSVVAGRWAVGGRVRRAGAGGGPKHRGRRGVGGEDEAGAVGGGAPGGGGGGEEAPADGEAVQEVRGEVRALAGGCVVHSLGLRSYLRAI